MSARDRRHMPQLETAEAALEPSLAPKREAVEAPASLQAADLQRPAALPPAAVEHLQREAGNAATASMMGGAQEMNPIPGTGRPLDSALGAKMSRSFGTDFSDVRVHSGPEAEASAAALQARAYTVGNHIVQGQSHADERTMAHELTHVVQQRSGPVAGTPMGNLNVSSPDDAFEQQADTVARQVVDEQQPLQMSSLSDPDPAAGDTASIQRFGFGDIMGMFGGGGGGGGGGGMMGGLMGGLGGMMGGAMSGVGGMASQGLGQLGGMAGGALGGLEGMASQGLGQLGGMAAGALGGLGPLGGMAGGALGGLEGMASQGLGQLGGMAGGALGGVEEQATQGAGGMLGGLGGMLGGLFG